MPEGDTLYRVARTLHRALAQHPVRRFASVYAPLLRIDEEAPLRGRTVLRVEARGKWCLIWLSPCVPSAKADAPPSRFDGRLILCTHLRINGMWHIYRSGATPDRDEPWQRPARDMRLLLATDSFVAVGFRVPIAELLTQDELARHRELQRLGPDLLAESFDTAEALQRLRSRDAWELGEALLDQSTLAGLGNVYKSEVCFLAGLDPFLPVRAVPDDVLRKVLAISRQLLQQNSAPARTFNGLRRTTAAMDSSRRLWVYGCAGRPCARCSSVIRQARQGTHSRVTFFCPRCQARTRALLLDAAPPLRQEDV